MKSIAKCCCVYFLSTLITPAITITFDDLSAGQFPAAIPSGYDGFQWSHFSVVDSQTSFGVFSAGIVSAPNAILSGDSVQQISRIDGFDLVSAVLTPIRDLAAPERVEVQGFDNGSLLYDNIFTLPVLTQTKVTFDYFGITDVKFIPLTNSIIPFVSPRFEMDNLTVNVPEAASTGLLLLAGIFTLAPFAAKLRR